MIRIQQNEIYALTLYQPWAWLMSQGYKLIENRPWKPPQKLIGQWIALHAGNVYDEDAVEFIGKRLPGQAPNVTLPTRDATIHGAVVAVGRLYGAIWDDKGDVKWLHYQPPLWVPKGGISVSGQLHKTGAEQDKRFLSWFFGPFGWAFDRMVLLNQPVKCRGFQRIWRLKSTEFNTVREAAMVGKSVAHDDLHPD